LVGLGLFAGGVVAAEAASGANPPKCDGYGVWRQVPDSLIGAEVINLDGARVTVTDRRCIEAQGGTSTILGPGGGVVRGQRPPPEGPRSAGGGPFHVRVGRPRATGGFPFRQPRQEPPMSIDNTDTDAVAFGWSEAEARVVTNPEE